MMELKELNESKVCDILNQIIEYEMAGVVKIAHNKLVCGVKVVPYLPL